jgi:hypothetical protein
MRLLRRPRVEGTTISIAELTDAGLSNHPAARGIFFSETDVVICRKHACDADFRGLLAQLRAPGIPIVVLLPHRPIDRGCLRCRLSGAGR